MNSIRKITSIHSSTHALHSSVLRQLRRRRTRTLPAVEVSHLSRREQEALLDAMRERKAAARESPGCPQNGKIRIWSGHIRESHIRKTQIWRTRRH